MNDKNTHRSSTTSPRRVKQTDRVPTRNDAVGTRRKRSKRQTTVILLRRTE